MKNISYSEYVALRQEGAKYMSQAIHGERMQTYLDTNWDKLSNFLSQDKETIQAWQLCRIREIVDYAFLNIPLYRKKYSEIGYEVGSIKTWDDFYKLPYLTKEELKGFKISNEPMLVSDIVKTLNSLKTNSNMANLKASKVTEWLVHLEILNVREINGRTYKLPSFTGEKMGLYIEDRIGYRGEYFVVRYPKQVQEFIINNFDNLLEYIKR